MSDHYELTEYDVDVFERASLVAGHISASAGSDLIVDWRRLRAAEQAAYRLMMDMDAELARLRAIETAAREVLASGQARYEVPPHGALPNLLGDPESRYVGDLVPAAAMAALRAAVDGETTAAGRDGCESEGATDGD